ncbi:hypothetical protein [Cellulomonas hominis]
MSGSGPGDTGTTSADDWREQRRVASAALAERLEQRRRAESARARELIAEFVRAAQARGVAPVPLRARGYSGTHRYRTDLEGWYLRRDETIAVGTDGEYYVLTVAGGLTARMRGTHVEPQDPPLVVGAGGKDGESVDLPVALARALGDADGPGVGASHQA